MNDSVVKLTDKLLEYLNSAEFFVKENAPDFMNQFIAYATWSAQYEFKIALTFLILLIVAQIFVVLLGWLKGSDGEATLMSFLTVGAVGSGVLLWTAGAYSDLKKLEIAPKVYMVEQAQKMFGGSK